MSNILQKTKAELGLTIIVIILSEVSASLVIFGPLDIIPYATYRDIALSRHYNEFKQVRI